MTPRDLDAKAAAERGARERTAWRTPEAAAERGGRSNHVPQYVQ